MKRGVIDSRLCRSIVATETNGRNLADQHIVLRHKDVFGHYAIGAEFVVIRQLHVTCRQRIRTTETLLFARRLILLLLVLVGPVELGAEEATVQRCPINHDRILLVVASIRHDRHDDVESRRHTLCTVELAHIRTRQRHGRIPQKIRHGIETLVEIEGIDTHGLLAHGRLIRITRSLVVIREGDVRGHGAENRGRMDLNMCEVSALDICRGHGDQHILRLTRINVLDQAVTAARYPRDHLIPRGPGLDGGRRHFPCAARRHHGP